MKTLDILSIWSTTIPTQNDKDLIDTEQFLSCGTFDEANQFFSVDHLQLQNFVALLCANNNLHPILRLLTNIAREHSKKQTQLHMRVNHDTINTVWTKIVAALFRNRWIMNLRSVLRHSGCPIGLEYNGYSFDQAFLLQGAYLSQIQSVVYNEPNTTISKKLFEEFSIIAFQILWTFAVLSRLGLYLMPPKHDLDIIFDTILIQRNRVDHYKDENSSENVYFGRNNDLCFSNGIYCVPVQRAFAIIRFEPEKTPHFAYAKVLGQKNKSINTNDIVEIDSDNPVIVTQSNVTAGQYLSLMATAFKRYIFRRTINGAHRVIAPLDKNFMILYRSLYDIQFAKNHNRDSVDVFFECSLAQLFWKNFNVGERDSIISLLDNPKACFSLLQMPLPVQETFQTAQPKRPKWKENWCCFPNIENNCFLNSVLYMLMCPLGYNNSFATSISKYSKQTLPTQEDLAFICAIKTRIDDKSDVERARNLLAHLFSSALYKAFTLSNYGTWSSDQLHQVNAEITIECKKLLPLLDIWSLVKRGSCLTNRSGEFQDLDECLLLLCSLLQYEYCCVSTIQITEEIRSVPFELAEEKKLDTNDLEQLSLMEKNNPLRLQVRSSLEPPLVRLSMDWVAGADSITGVVDFQEICNANFIEYSMTPAPQQSDQPRATRFYGKRHLWSLEKQLIVVHLPRRNSLHSLYNNRIVFPADEILIIAGQQMRIVSMVLWSSGHYTSIVKSENRWWHINDLNPPGYRCREIGDSLTAAVDAANNHRLLITAVACMADTDTDAGYNLSRQLCIEVDKFCNPTDGLRDKAAVFKKDQERFTSLQTCLELFASEITELPRRFQFGNDDPNIDFRFQEMWYDSNYQFAEQPINFSLVLAHAIKPGCAPVYNLNFDVVAEEERIRNASTLFNTEAIILMHQRALTTCYTLTNAVIGLHFINTSLQIMHMIHMQISAREYLAKRGSKYNWFNDSTKKTFWMNLTDFLTLLQHPRDTAPIFCSNNILLPLSDSGCWSLIRIQPQSRIISCYDILARKADQHLNQIAYSLVIAEKNNTNNSWTLQNIFHTPVITQDTQESEDASEVLQYYQNASAVSILYFSQQIFQNEFCDRVEAPQLTNSSVQEMREEFARKIEKFGNLECL